jgi:PAS domain S-box-containing protein
MLLSGLMGVLSLVGWWLEIPVLIQISHNFIPIAPGSSLILIALSAAWFAQTYRQIYPGLQAAVRICAISIPLVSLILLINSFVRIDSDWVRLLGLDTILTARMSPIAAVSFLLASLAFLLLNGVNSGPRLKSLAVGLLILVFSTGTVMMVGYLYGAPLLYGSAITPVSLITAIGLALLGAGLIASAGATYWPVRTFMGDSVQAHLIRAFVPVAILITLIHSGINALTIPWLDNPGLSVAVSMILELVIVVIAVTQTARRIGTDFDLNTASRQRAEQALRASEENYRRLVMNLQEGIGVIDREAKITFANPCLADILGYAVPEVEGKNLSAFVDEHSLEKMNHKLKRCALGAQDQFDLEFLKRDGGQIYTSLSIAPLFDDRGNYHGALVSVADISRRKRSEDALRERLKEMTCLYSVRRDMQEPLTVDELCQRIVEHLIPAMQFPEITVPVIELESRRFTISEYTPQLSHYITAEIRVAGQKHGRMWIYYRNDKPFILPEEQDLLDSIADRLGLWIDRNRADLALQQALRQLNLHLDNSPLAVVEADREFRIIRWTGTAQQIFGWTAAEMMGKHLADLFWVYDEDRSAVERIMSDMQQGQNFSNIHRNRNIHKDGSIVQCEWYNTATYDPSGQLVSVLSQALDVTERNQARRELEQSREQLRALSQYLQSVREEERTFMAREIHDELGQALTATKMDLTWISKHLSPKQTLLAEKIAILSNLIDATIQTVRRVATELRPGMLDDLGLVPALEWQIQEFSRRTGIRYQLDLGEDLRPLERDVVTVLFRIFQETLTNITRHAQATEVKVRLIDAPDQVTLIIQDNGRGIQSAEMNNPRSLGLLGMRERALSVGGTLTIQGALQEGTCVTVSVPRI